MTWREDRETFRGGRFDWVDFAGATFRDCGFSGVKAVSCTITDVRLSGFVQNLVVNDVDVSAYVEAELDRRQPERIQLRAVRTADDHRAMWATIEERWAAAVDRARQVPEAVRQEQVDGEWSFVETLRHLVFATDAWAARTILDEERPYHRLGLTQSGYDPVVLGIDADARPSMDEVLEVRADRMAMVGRIVAELNDEGLQRMCARAPGPGYPKQPRSVETCLRVVMGEEVAHLGYALRDLAVLEARA